MTERSNAIGPKETAKDADVGFRHLAIGISRDDPISEGLLHMCLNGFTSLVQ